jgi:hypothetical protein
MTISGAATYVMAKSDNMPGYGYDAQNVMQQFIWAARQVNYPDLKNYRNEDGSKYNWNYNYHNNPYFTLHENLNKLNRDRIYGNAKVQYQFTDNLSAFIRTGVDGYNNLNTERAPSAISTILTDTIPKHCRLSSSSTPTSSSCITPNSPPTWHSA